MVKLQYCEAGFSEYLKKELSMEWSKVVVTLFLLISTLEFSDFWTSLLAAFGL
jgi:hypothetical protein